MVKKIETKKSTTSTLRPPIVVVMGHVDHGKTTLLDTIRKTAVAAKEAGGITQKIGAYQIDIDEKIHHPKKTVQDGFTDISRKITFIDTPGHEAFAKMRSRGAQVADIALLVVAANDGVMPQTRESIKFIKEASIPMIAVINKSDLPDANADKVIQQLAKEDVLVEKLGGQVPVAQVSAKNNQGIKELLDLIILVWEMQEKKPAVNNLFQAVVIEAKMDKKRGVLATIIVKNGTLNIRDVIYTENTFAKVKAMISDSGKNLTQVFPGTPVEIMGWDKLPIVGSEISNKEILQNRTEKSAVTNYDLSLPPVDQSHKLKMILKADNFGSLEAISEKLPENVDLVQTGISEINEADVLLAKSTGAVIIGFNLHPNTQTLGLARAEKVKIKIYKLIYELLEEITDVVNLLNQPQATEEILGEAQIIAQFQSGVTRIAGCKVVSGRIAKGDKVKILRGDNKSQEIAQSRIKSVHHGKQDVAKAVANTECGVVFDKKLDFILGDRIISYRNKELL